MVRKNLLYRMTKAALIGLFFSSLYMLFAWFYFAKPETGFERTSRLGIFVACLSIILTYVYFVLRCTMHRVRWFALIPLGFVLLVALFYTNIAIYLLGVPIYEFPDFTPEYWPLIRKAYGWFGLLPYMMAIVPPAAVYRWEYVREMPRFAQWFLEGRGGKWGYGSLASFSRLKAKLKNKYNIFATVGILSKHIILGKADIDDCPLSPLVAVKDDANMLTIGCVGSGKSVSSLWPNMMTYNGSMIVLDMKGEHARQTFFRRSSKEHLNDLGMYGRASKHLKNGRALMLDPYHENRDMSIAAMHQAILTDIDPDDPRGRELVEAVVDGCILPESPENRFFEEVPKMLLKGVIAHVLTRYPKECHNFPFIFDLICGVTEKNGSVDFKAFETLLFLMLKNNAMGGWPQQAAAQILQESPKTRGNILTNIFRSLEWAGDPAMRKHLSKSDFSLKEVSADPRRIDTLYIVLPEGMMSAQMRWLRVLTSVLITHLRNRPVKPDIPTLFVLDEFPRLGGRIDVIAKGWATLRSSKVKLWGVVQNISQLSADYPDHWQNFIANSTIQMFGIHDEETAKFASFMLGRRVLERRKKGNIVAEASREVLTPQEIITKYHKSANKQLVFPTTGLPLRLVRLAYKRMRIDGHLFRNIGFRGLSGHYEF